MMKPMNAQTIDHASILRGYLETSRRHAQLLKEENGLRQKAAAKSKERPVSPRHANPRAAADAAIARRRQQMLDNRKEDTQ